MNTGHKPQQEYRVGVGASSILMIFIILCLTTLGVLSFASARANLQLTTRRQTQVQAYYATQAEAQRLLARIDEALLAARAEPNTYDEQVKSLAALDERIAVKNNGTVELTLPVGQTQELHLTLAIGGAEDATRYTVMTHYLINIEEWEPDTSLELMV